MKQRLKAVLDRFGHTQADLAELLGVTYQTVSIKMNQHNNFNQYEIFLIMQFYNLTPEEVVDIFFNVEDFCKNKEA